MSATSSLVSSIARAPSPARPPRDGLAGGRRAIPRYRPAVGMRIPARPRAVAGSTAGYRPTVGMRFPGRPSAGLITASRTDRWVLLVTLRYAERWLACRLAWPHAIILCGLRGH